MRPPDAGVAIGNLDSRFEAIVDGAGNVVAGDGAWSLSWRIRVADDWLDPEPVSQRAVDGAPVMETAVRVPGGLALHRAWCTLIKDAELVVVEVENRSPTPFAVAFSQRGAIEPVAARPPSLIEDVGHVYPVPHAATIRLAVPLAAGGAPGLDVAAVADADAVARGWRLHLDRGMRIELPDEALADAVRAALATALIVGDGPRVERRDRRAVWGALSRWGHGDGRRAPAPTSLPPDLNEAIELLATMRARLVGDDERGVIALAVDWPDEWLGQPLAVHNAPTREGSLSYAVRWHGARPALLWELDHHPRRGEATRMTAPGLDPSWSTTELAGEALLGPIEPPGGLPGVVAPLPPDRTPVDEVPDEGGSFS